ncbi:MAG: hypothetical protein IPI35_35375 [Deltaproteobacteria bacterium]|nr:hypothetical protein [Deltaproteobacteria bacterium]
MIFPALLQLFGCVLPPQPEEGDVLTLSFCPDGLPCELVADGQSLITVEACVPEAVELLAEDLTLSLVTSGGPGSTAHSRASCAPGPIGAGKASRAHRAHPRGQSCGGGHSGRGRRSAATRSPRRAWGLALTFSPATLNPKRRT